MYRYIRQIQKQFYPKGIDWDKEINYDFLKQQYTESAHNYTHRIGQLSTKFKKAGIVMMQTFIRGLLSKGSMSFEEALDITALLKSAKMIKPECADQEVMNRTLKGLVSQVQLQSTMEATNRPSPTHVETQVRSQPPRVSQELITSAGTKTITCCYCSKKGHTK